MSQRKEHIHEHLTDIGEALEAMPGRRDKLEFLMEYGEEMEQYPEELKTPERKVPGCVSGVYIAMSLDNEGKLHFKAHSDALIVKGFVRILITALENVTPEELLEAKEVLEAFVAKHELAESLIASRANAFGSIYRFMAEKSKSIMETSEQKN